MVTLLTDCDESICLCEQLGSNFFDTDSISKKKKTLKKLILEKSESDKNHAKKTKQYNARVNQVNTTTA